MAFTYNTRNYSIKYKSNHYGRLLFHRFLEYSTIQQLSIVWSKCNISPWMSSVVVRRNQQVRKDRFPWKLWS